MTPPAMKKKLIPRKGATNASSSKGATKASVSKGTAIYTSFSMKERQKERKGKKNLFTTKNSIHIMQSSC